MGTCMRRVVIIGSGLGAAAMFSCTPVASSPGAGAGAAALTSPIWVACDTLPRTSASGGVVPVEICAADDARLYGPGNAPPKGRPVARMRNLGTERDLRWGMRPRRVYVIAVHSDAAGLGYKIWPEGPGGPIKVGSYYPCGHGGQSPPTSSATFGACGDTVVTGPPARGTLASRGPAESGSAGKPSHVLFDVHNGPAWISCTDGCCTTDQN